MGGILSKNEKGDEMLDDTNDEGSVLSEKCASR